MTRKQQLIAQLNVLRAEIDRLPPLNDKQIARMSVGVVQNNIDLYLKLKGN